LALWLAGGLLPGWAQSYTIGFGQATYNVVTGQSFAIPAVISPVPSNGLFSESLSFTLSPSNAVGGITSLTVPLALNHIGVPTNSPAVIAVSNSFALVRGTINALVNPAPYTNSLLALLAITNLPVGSFTLSSALYKPLGPTESVVLDGNGTVLDPQITFAPATLVVQPPPGWTILSGYTLNRQNGLFEQSYQLQNTASVTNPAYRILLQNMAPNDTLYYAQGSANGIPYAQYNWPVPPGGTVNMIFDYYVPDRLTMPNPTFQVQPATPTPAPTTGTVTPVASATRLTNGSFLVQFDTQAGRNYYIQYSASNADPWQTAWPAVTGTGQRLQWIDNGAPKTDSFPTATRYYRLLAQ
jgi:hypothetical protein